MIRAQVLVAVHMPVSVGHVLVQVAEVKPTASWSALRMPVANGSGIQNAVAFEAMKSLNVSEAVPHEITSGPVQRQGGISVQHGGQ